MADNTPNFGFILPTDGGDSNLWGGFLNANWGSIDTLLKATNDQVVVNTDATTALAIRVTTLEAQMLKAQIQIGELYVSKTDDDPATTLGYGTWGAAMVGRAFVGVGDNGVRDWTIGLQHGEDKHQITVLELPAHGHGLSQATNTSIGGSTTRVQGGGSDAASQSTGGDDPHNNVQPSEAVYAWERLT